MFHLKSKLILDGIIKTPGIHIPIIPEIYEPILLKVNFYYFILSK